jgi:RNA polymerase-binding transcription factor DksA/ribosome-associated translation inhibitor RaiA
MNRSLTLTVRNLSLSDVAAGLIREQADKLESLGHDITACRVLVDVPHRHHHQGKAYNVRITLVVPGTELVINREPHEDLYTAIRDAFDTARRRLDDFRRRRGAANTRSRRNAAEAPPPIVAEPGASREDALRAMMHRAREAAIRDIETQIGRRLEEAGLERMGAALDVEDRAALDLSDDVDLALLGMRYRRFKELSDAFRRLEDGTYGRCETCGTDIPLDRLEVEPSARHCVGCLERIEAVERVEREEQRFKTAYTPPPRGEAAGRR